MLGTPLFFGPEYKVPSPPRLAHGSQPEAGPALLRMAGFPTFRIAVHGNRAPMAGFPSSRASVQAICYSNSGNLPPKPRNPCTAAQEVGKPAMRSSKRCTEARKLGKPANSEEQATENRETCQPQVSPATRTRKTCRLRRGQLQQLGKPASSKEQATETRKTRKPQEGAIRAHATPVFGASWARSEGNYFSCLPFVSQ